MTVLVVTQMAMAPLSAPGGPTALSARDGGLAVTSPRMSVSIAPPLVIARPPADDRAPTGVRPSPTTIPVALAVRPEANPAAPVALAVRPEANPAAPVVLTRSTKQAVAQPVPQSPQGQFAPAATLATTTAIAGSAVNVTGDEPPEASVTDQPTEVSQAFRVAQPADAAQHPNDTTPANDAQDAKSDTVSHRIE
jgi:hypothetical protein